MQIKMTEIVKTRILMVCLGNICRSPLAEGVMKNVIRERNLDDFLEVDSCGTAGFHVGKLPDPRSMEIARRHGFELEHRGRQLLRRDFKNFDFILVMDESNLENTLKLAHDDTERAKVFLISHFDERPKKPRIVADPYWGELKDFENVYQQLVHCCEGWLLFYLEERKKASAS